MCIARLHKHIDISDACFIHLVAGSAGISSFSYPIDIALLLTRRLPVEGKSSVCLICRKYWIIISIIIIISLGHILLLSYITNSSRTYAHTRSCMREHTYTHTVVATVQVSAIRWRPTVAARSAGIHSRQQGHSNKHTRWPPDFPEILDAFGV